VQTNSAHFCRPKPREIQSLFLQQLLSIGTIITTLNFAQFWTTMSMVCLHQLTYSLLVVSQIKSVQQYKIVFAIVCLQSKILGFFKDVLTSPDISPKERLRRA
jgi:hypothetical protein